MLNYMFNRSWSKLILEALTRHNVKHICIAPGSRSTPLTLEAALNPKLTCHTHFDERGLGHFALGLAKVTQLPVAVIVTSGTAVANLYPALIEAGLTGEKLILLTADRPPELINCGANQAIEQEGIFAQHPRISINLPRPTVDISAKWLVSRLDEALGRLYDGVIHINCPFAEPLYGDEIEYECLWSQQLGEWWQQKMPWLQVSQTSYHDIDDQWQYWCEKKGLIIAGRLTAIEGAWVAQWAEQLGWPILADALSSTGQPLPHCNLWLGHPQAQEILAETEIVIQFGGSITGKKLLQLQSTLNPQQYWLIDRLSGRKDPFNHYGQRIIATIPDWIERHPVGVINRWATGLDHLVKQTQAMVKAQLTIGFGEAEFAYLLPELLAENGQFFAGNSLSVRLIDAFAQLPQAYPVWSNRGASGIDGLISTLAGVQAANDQPTLAVIGDISALYDLNSLALLRNNSTPVVLVVINNDGGAIFSLLNTSVTEYQQFYQLPHGVTFQGIAEMFGISYCSPSSMVELQQKIQQHWSQSGTLLVEMNVPHDQGAQTLKQMMQQVAIMAC